MGQSDKAQQTLFRPMKRADVPHVAQIEQACFRTPWTERMLKHELKNELAHYHVLEYDGALVGYLGMWVLFDEAHITNVAVLPAYRGKGYGKLQMLLGMRVAASLGAKQMTLEVRAGNTVAQKLYFGLDFVVEGRRRKYYQDNGEDALILWNTNIEATLKRLPLHA